jgi:hypothetical protein
MSVLEFPPAKRKAPPCERPDGLNKALDWHAWLKAQRWLAASRGARWALLKIGDFPSQAGGSGSTWLNIKLR